MDPTIPKKRKPAGFKSAAMTWGYFYKNINSGVIRLSSHTGATWELPRVTIKQGSFGHGNEGFSKLPRPREVGEDGEVIVEGDKVVIHFIDGDPRLPLVEGGIRRIAPHDFLPYNHAVDGADPNRLAGRLEPLDADGQPVGLIEWEACHDGGASFRVMFREGGEKGPRTFFSFGGDKTVELRTGDGAILKLADTNVSISNSAGDGIVLDGDSKTVTVYRQSGELLQIQDGKVQIMATTVELVASNIHFSSGVAGASERLPKELLLTDILGMIFDVNAAIGGVPDAAVAAKVVAINLALAGPGLPYVSTVTKTA